MEKEEMKWKRDCDISELPTRLRRLAEYRNEHCHFIGDNTNGVNSFYWGDTPEGSTFWAKVCSGIAPSNLEEVLDRFEKEHPELLDAQEDYIIKDLGVNDMGNKIGFSKTKLVVPSTNSKEPAIPSSTIDWEQRRYEIAKGCLVAFNSNNNPQICDADSTMRANWAVADADALIAELKKTQL